MINVTPSPEGMTRYLRERVKESAEVGYHRTSMDAPRLLAFRARDDVEFREKLKLKHVRYTVASDYDHPTFFPHNKEGRGTGTGRGGNGGRGGGRGNVRRAW